MEVSTNKKAVCFPQTSIPCNSSCRWTQMFQASSFFALQKAGESAYCSAEISQSCGELSLFCRSTFIIPPPVYFRQGINLKTWGTTVWKMPHLYCQRSQRFSFHRLDKRNGLSMHLCHLFIPHGDIWVRDDSPSRLRTCRTKPNCSRGIHTLDYFQVFANQIKWHKNVKCATR